MAPKAVALGLTDDVVPATVWTAALESDPWSLRWCKAVQSSCTEYVTGQACEVAHQDRREWQMPQA